MNLQEWIVHYVKARDAMERKLKNIEEKPGSVICHYKDKTVTFLPVEKLGAAATGQITLVAPQNQQNFDALVQHFPEYAKNPLLTIIFVNLKLNEKWMIKPATHASVADKANLKAGLLSMYQAVPSS